MALTHWRQIEDADYRGLSEAQYEAILAGTASGHALNADGWRVFRPKVDVGADSTRLFYVDLENGNDTTAATAGAGGYYLPGMTDIGSDPTNPTNIGNIVAYRTPLAAYAGMRDGKPDWMLIRRGTRGDVDLSPTNWTKSGPSETDRIVVTWYGSGDMPNITGRVYRSIGNSSSPPVRQNVAFAYLDFTIPSVEPYSDEFDLAFTSTGSISLGVDVNINNLLFCGCDLHRRAFVNEHGGGNVRLERCPHRGSFSMSTAGGTLPNTCSHFANSGRPDLLTGGHGGVLEWWQCTTQNGGFARELCTVFNVLASGNGYVVLTETSPAAWAAITDGSFEFRTIANSTYRQVTGVDFSGVASLADVAAVIMAAIQATENHGTGCTAEHYPIAEGPLGAASLPSGPWDTILFRRGAGAIPTAFRDIATPTGTPIAGMMHRGYQLNAVAGVQHIPTDDTILRRNWYFRSHRYGLLRECISDYSASEGAQVGNGSAYRNLFLRDTSGMWCGTAPHRASHVNYNAVLYLRPQLVGDSPLSGVELRVNDHGGEMIGNLCMHGVTGARAAFTVNVLEGNEGSGIVRDNIAYKWRRGILVVNSLAVGGIYGDVVIKDNILSNAVTDQYVVYFNNSADLSAFSFEGNIWNHPSASTPFTAIGSPGSPGNFAWWTALSGETDGGTTPPSWSDPDRKISTYLASIGDTTEYATEDAAVDAFMDRALGNRITNWDEAYTAGAVINYLRDGFDLDPAPAGVGHEEIPGPGLEPPPPPPPPPTAAARLIFAGSLVQLGGE